MRLNIKTHRRNKALQQFDECFRLSYVPLQTHFSPSTLRNSLQPTENNRNSDLSCFSRKSSISKQHEKIVKNSIVQQKYSKNGSALIQSLSLLSSKLIDAKNLLQRGKPHLQETKTPLQMFKKESLQTNEIVVSGRKQDKNEESTLNLESRKLLKNNCKQKIVWANSLKHYYIASVIRGMAGINDRAYQHIYQSHQFIKSYQNFIAPKTYIPLNLPCHPLDKFKKVLVIDLDQTLIHCETEQSANCEIEVQIDQGEKGYISIRPYALSFLKKMSKYYEIIVFTASEKDYADSILNELDSQGLIRHRLYRDHCLKIDKKMYSKDLRIINRDLSQMIIVDNSALSFLCQPQNAVPILPYLGGEDRQLLQLQKYLELLSKQEDVRVLNRKLFRLQSYSSYECCQQLVSELYESMNYY